MASIESAEKVLIGKSRENGKSGMAREGTAMRGDIHDNDRLR